MICEACACDFTPGRFAGDRQRWCSDKCRKAGTARDNATPLWLVCASYNCTRVFRRRTKNHIFCSHACADRHRSWTRRALVEPIECAWCETKFEPRTARTLYCSQRCRQAAAYARRPKARFGVRMATCSVPECSNLFVVRGPTHCYCSHRCKQLANKRAERETEAGRRRSCEDAKRYYDECREYVLARKRRYYRDNKETINAKHRAYYRANRERLLAQNAEYKRKRRAANERP